MTIGPAAMLTARLGAWDALDPAMRARHLRAFVVMSLQAASLRMDSLPLGTLSAASFADEEHNAAGAAVARTLLLLVPRKPILLSKSMLTVDGTPAIQTGDPGTGLAPLVIVLIACAAAAAGAAIVWLTSPTIAAKDDAADFRENKTKQLVSTQAAAIDVLARHAEREKLAGKPLPFTDDEKRLLRALEDAQRDITAERKQPLPAPFEGASTFFKEAGEFLGGLLPIALIGGALYWLSRQGGEGALLPHPEAEAPTTREAPHAQQALTLTRNPDGVYEYTGRS